MFRHSNIRVDHNSCGYHDLQISEKERETLKILASRVRTLSELPRMKENRRLWKKHNALQSERPMILCDPENGWHEIIPEDSLVCTGDVARMWELTLRKQIFWGEEMNDDYVLEPVFDVSHIYSEKTWRKKGMKETTHGFQTQLDGGAYHIDPFMDSYDELDLILPPEITVDYKTTEILMDLARNIMEPHLKVQNRTVWFWSYGLTDEFSQIRGMDKMLFDFFDHPEGFHALMNIIKEGTLARLDFLEKNNLFYPNNNYTYVGSGGLGYTSELTAEEPAKMSGMWGHCESQITVGVSPDMFNEFIFPYQKEIMEKFGLCCYGCCEPMDDRIETVKQVKQLRRVSVSAWADPQVMSDKLKKDYIYSMKPSPTPLSTPEMDKEAVVKELEEKLKITRDRNCVEIIMKDNHTIGNNPKNVTEWVELAKRAIGI